MRLGLSPYWWTPLSPVASPISPPQRLWGVDTAHGGSRRSGGELGGRTHICLGSSYVFVRASNSCEEPLLRTPYGAVGGVFWGKRRRVRRGVGASSGVAGGRRRTRGIADRIRTSGDASHTCVDVFRGMERSWGQNGTGVRVCVTRSSIRRDHRCARHSGARVIAAGAVAAPRSPAASPRPRGRSADAHAPRCAHAALRSCR